MIENEHWYPEYPHFVRDEEHGLERTEVRPMERAGHYVELDDYGRCEDVDEVVGRACDVHIETMTETECWADIGGLRCWWSIDGVREVWHKDGTTSVQRERGKPIRLRLMVEPEHGAKAVSYEEFLKLRKTP